MNTFLAQIFQSNIGRQIYGILKKLQQELGLQDWEIDDGVEKDLRQYGLFFLIFLLLFAWTIYQSLSSTKRK
jgi:hypothetical protein